MKLGIVISSNDAETAWNAVRLGNFALKAGDDVRMFLLAKGVESAEIEESRFNVKEQLHAFVSLGGEVLACGTCLKIRNKEGSELCPLSSMADLYDIIKNSDRVISV